MKFKFIKVEYKLESIFFRMNKDASHGMHEIDDLIYNLHMDIFELWDFPKTSQNWFFRLFIYFLFQKKLRNLLKKVRKVHKNIQYIYSH